MSSAIIKIELYQPCAQYRNPFTFYYAQSYPLPPRSTVIGMIKNLLGKFDLNENLEFVICGKYGSVFNHYSSFIKGREILFEPSGLMILQERRGKKIKEPLFISQRTPLYQQELQDVHLEIFVKSSEELINEILAKLQNLNKLLTLGRGSDIVFIRRMLMINKEKVKEVEVKDKLMVRGTNILVPAKYFEKINFQRATMFWMAREIDYKDGNNYLYSIFSTDRTTARRNVSFEKVYYLEEGGHILKEGSKLRVEYYEEDGRLKLPLFWW